MLVGARAGVSNRHTLASVGPIAAWDMLVGARAGVSNRHTFASVGPIAAWDMLGGACDEPKKQKAELLRGTSPLKHRTSLSARRWRIFSTSIRCAAALGEPVVPDR